MRTADQIVHVRASGPSPSRRLRTALGQARLSPAALSPSAVLAVRRLADPLPGAVGDGRRLPPRWERAAREALDDLRRRAVRPRGGHVPEEADAVLFADEAEWRACAALAFAQAARPWWADTLTGPAVATVLAEVPHLVPAVLDALVAWGEAARVLATVPAPEAEALLAAACEAGGGPVIAREAGGRPPWVSGPLPWSTSEPLAAAVAEVDRRVGRVQAALLGVGVTLARAPHRRRRPEAAAAVVQGQSDSTASPFSKSSSPPLASTGGEVDRARRLGVGAAPVPRQSSPLPPGHEENTASAPPALLSPEAALPESTASEAEATTETDPLRPESDAPTDGASTRLGGVFFLLPLMLAFGWPEAEEATWRLASTTGTWGVLDALARVLLGDRLGTHADDPLWRLLAHLDGRDPDTPPRDAVAPVATDLSASVLGLPPSLTAWTQTVLPEVQARLVDALDLSASSEIPEALLLREATIYVTRSHVDVVFPLTSATLAVRRAGLDADPGWVPSVGRVLQFHYR